MGFSEKYCDEPFSRNQAKRRVKDLEKVPRIIAFKREQRKDGQRLPWYDLRLFCS